jgi:hypothetical protein
MADLTAMLQAAAGQVTGGEYQISRSLRFNSADSAYLSRTFASAGDRRTFTWSGWYKRTKLTQSGAPGLDELFVTGATDGFAIRFNTDDTIRIYNFSAGYQLNLITSAVYRDASSWYHVVVAIDTTQATDTNRAKLYVNGTQVTAFGTAVYPTQNTDLLVNQAIQHSIGSNLPWGGSYADCYMTEINFIDGQALTPSSFGETNETTGVWSPIQFNGPWNVGTGVNGFYLNFSDNTSTTTLGEDQAGSNDWTLNNFSVTAGAGNDSLVDTPTQYGTDTGAGGEVRGNYATLNSVSPLASGTLANGNLNFTTGNADAISVGTIAVSSGKWYWEITATTVSAAKSCVGIIGQPPSSLTVDLRTASNGFCYISDGNKGNNNSTSAYGASYTNGDVIGVALDLDAGTLVFYKNNSSQGTAYSSLSGTFAPALSDLAGASGGSVFDANFGQRPFAYTAPSGFKALVTTNLPQPTVVQGDDYFNTVLFTGTGAAGNAVTVGFQPDFVWIKDIDLGGYHHVLQDAVRGANNVLYSNLTVAEYGASGFSFTSTGFTVGTGIGDINVSGSPEVAWNWKANGAGVSNTAGTITGTVTVSANTIAGISIVTYTGNGVAGATVGHGLGAVPRMIIVKNRDAADAWQVYQAANTANPETDYLVLNTTAATADALDRWNDTAPTLSVFSLGDGVEVNTNTEDYVAYCFAEIEGFSKFSSYTGNGLADGPFVYTGFRPAWVMFKRTSTTSNWVIFDVARGTYNSNTPELQPNTSDAEASLTGRVDLLSNGLKFTSDSFPNNSGDTFIYAAFAENPFKYSLAR